MGSLHGGLLNKNCLSRSFERSILSPKACSSSSSSSFRPREGLYVSNFDDAVGPADALTVNGTPSWVFPVPSERRRVPPGLIVPPIGLTEAEISYQSTQVGVVQLCRPQGTLPLTSRPIGPSRIYTVVKFPAMFQANQ